MRRFRKAVGDSQNDCVTTRFRQTGCGETGLQLGESCFGAGGPEEQGLREGEGSERLAGGTVVTDKPAVEVGEPQEPILAFSISLVII